MDYQEVLLNEKMSAEEKIEALKKLEVVEKSAYDKLKKANDDASHEASEWKKKYNSTLDEAQKKAQAEADANAERDKELAKLRKEVSIANNAKKYIALGYSEDEATKAAGYLYDGNTDKLFELQKNVMDALTAKIKADVAKQTPGPLGGDGAGTPAITLDAFRKMSTTDRLKFAQEHADEYRQLYEGGE
jgi:hypothetical protein